VKPREKRQSVIIKARMRSGASWNQVSILNLSIRGLAIQVAKPPERGSYVEICRGSHVIVARVMWAEGHRAGLRSQDAIFVREIVNEGFYPQRRIGPASVQPVERRQGLRTFARRYERSRLAGRAMEFGSLAIVAGAIAVMAFGTIEYALARPMSRISAVLGDR